MTNLADGVVRTVETYDKVVSDQLVIGNGVKTQLAAADQDCWQCLVQSSYNSVGTIRVGPNHWPRHELNPGESVSFPCDPSLLYAIGTDAADTVNWTGMR